MFERGQYHSQVERLCTSEVLHSSESLCRLLRYLAQKEIENPGTHIKEYQIATEVYGRPADFDPQVDSTIRVQAARLRGKLGEYYSGPGAGDPIVVELPRGAYSLQFHRRVRANGNPSNRENAPRLQATAGSRFWPLAALVLAAVVVILAAALAVVVRGHETAQASQSEPPVPAFRVFWQPFLKSPEEPWVIFSNGAFVGRPESGMRYFDPKRDANSQKWDHYTGVGEVLAIHELDRVFGLLRRQIRVKRGSLFSLDDAKNNNLIFIGSPFENLTLLEIPGTQEFIFRRAASGPRKGDEAIINVHPRPGEAKEFFGPLGNAPLTEDYAVVALVKGLNPGQAVLILAGTTTIGTQAAVEYVCRQNSVEELLLRLPVSQTGQLKPFEAVLRVKVTRGVPVGTELVALRSSTS